MKILTIVSSGYEQGGVENTVARYNRIYKNEGHDARILSSNVRPDVPHYSDYEFEAIPNNGARKIINELFNFSAYRVAKKVLKEFAPDVVVLHTMQQVTPSVVFLLRKYPTIQCVHGPEAFTTSLLPWHIDKQNFANDTYDLESLSTLGKLRYSLLRYPYGLFYKIALKNADKLLVFSSYMRDLMCKDGYSPNKVVIMPIGTALYKFAAKKNTLSPTIGYAGRLEIYKGVTDLIDAMPTILAKIPKARLDIAGDGSYANELKKQVALLGLEKSIIFKGHLSSNDISKFYNNISVFVMPSTWPEAFGKVGIEAMSTGTPVVATDVGGVKDWLRDSFNGYLIKPSRPDQIASSVINILSDSNLRNEMSQNARKTSEKFSMDSFADNLYVMLEKIINDRQTISKKQSRQ